MRLPAAQVETGTGIADGSPGNMGNDVKPRQGKWRTDLDIAIRGGMLVTSSEAVQADLGIRGGLIACIGHDLVARETIDATGKLVIPGAIDPHVHLQMPSGDTMSSDNWETGTLAAAHGGTTTIIDFVEPSPGETLLNALEAREAQTRGQCAIDYGLHMTLPNAAAPTLDQVSPVIDAGLSSFKLYTTYEGVRLSDSEMLEGMAAIGQAGGLAIVHAENDAIIEWLTRRLLDGGMTAPGYHPLSRPEAAEVEAIQRVVALAEVADVAVYVAHVSTALGAEAVARARSRGRHAYGETCPHYLLLTEQEYRSSGVEAAKFVCSPPLRKESDNSALWRALDAGSLQVVSTDHCPFFFRGQKDVRDKGFDCVPAGLPGIETRLALLYTYGVCQGRIDLHRWVDICSCGAARLFGLYPRKGTLMPGADADVVVFDPKKRVRLTTGSLHQNVDYTPYEGREVIGYPTTTILRGEVLVHEGQLVGRRGGGQFVKRARFRAT